jgi:hypothetical protein
MSTEPLSPRTTTGDSTDRGLLIAVVLMVVLGTVAMLAIA